MKQSNFILSLLIPGRNSPGSDIDVYLEPPVDDMVDMFLDGVRTYDASTREYFQLHAAIIIPSHCRVTIAFPNHRCQKWVMKHLMR